MSDNPLETVPVVAARRVKSKSKSKSKPNGAATGTSTADPNNPTISITLPKDVLEWYKQQAKEAPFEPSVQKFVAWQLRQFAAERQQAQRQTQVLLEPREPQKPRESAGATAVMP